jgi:hypothetical protein
MSQRDHDHEANSTLEIPAELSARQRLEWEVSQLADGTLARDRRGAVEAALLADGELRSAYEAHRRVAQILREDPGIEAELSDTIMQLIAEEPVYGDVAPARRHGGSESGPSIGELVRNWWVTIGAVAAALVVGLTIGRIVFGPPDQDSGLTVSLGGGTTEANIQVTGPAVVLQQQQEALGGDSLAVSFSGLDYRDYTRPELESSLPDYASHYAGSAVVETSGRMIIASVDGDLTE